MELFENTTKKMEKICFIKLIKKNDKQFPVKINKFIKLASLLFKMN